MEDTWDSYQGDLEMRIVREDSVGLVVDIQERLYPVMDRKEELLKKCLILLEGLKALEVPLLLTEQYPKGLGPTLEPLRQLLGPVEPVEKAAFSCCEAPALSLALDRLARKKVIICGIEAHVCVLQTVVDLAERGYTPVVVADGISSRSLQDKEVALERMKREGAILTTVESILFELTRVSGTDLFRTISKLVK